MKKLARKLFVCILGTCLLFAAGFSGLQGENVQAASKFKIHYISVGQADSALLQYGEGSDAKYALIDAGLSGGTYEDGTPIPSTTHAYLKEHGVKHLEFVLLTHPHKDHIGGMESILNDKSIVIDRIYGNPKILEYLESSDNKEEQSEETAQWTEFSSVLYTNVMQAIQMREDAGETCYEVPEAGETIPFGGAKLTFFGPLENNYQYGRAVDLNTRQENKYSIVAKIQNGSNTFLMTGDAQKETIEKIIAKGYDLTSQVLKIPHHGFQDVTEAGKVGNYTTDHKLVFDKSKASIAIISNGETPHSKVLNALANKNVYQTKTKGTIVVTSDGQKLSIGTQRGGTDPSYAGDVSGKSVLSSALMSRISVSSNMKTKLYPASTQKSNTYNLYEKKNITVRFYGTVNPFTNLTNVQYKFVKKGVDNRKVAYRNGTYITVKNGACGRIYVRYNTPLGSTTVKLPGFTVDTKAPSGAKIRANKSGIKTLKTSAKNTYKKRYKKSIRFTFSASYGTSGKYKTQYKIVPKGKKHSKYKWKTANSITYKKKNKKVRLYVKYIDKSGNATYRKTNGFYLK